MQHINDEQWQTFEDQGYLHLGQVATDEELLGLQKRMDEIMLGTAPVDYSRMMMQLDSLNVDPYRFKSCTVSVRCLF